MRPWQTVAEGHQHRQLLQGHRGGAAQHLLSQQDLRPLLLVQQHQRRPGNQSKFPILLTREVTRKKMPFLFIIVSPYSEHANLDFIAFIKSLLMHLSV